MGVGRRRWIVFASFDNQPTSFTIDCRVIRYDSEGMSGMKGLTQSKAFWFLTERCPERADSAISAAL